MERLTDAAPAAKGAALLDSHGPAGWQQLISVSTLDILAPSNCVIGQLYPDARFTPAAERLFIRAGLLPADYDPWDEEAAAEFWGLVQEHGFCAGNSGVSYGELTRQWRELISSPA